MKFRPLISLSALPAFLMWLPTASADWNSTISAANPLHWYTFEPDGPGVPLFVIGDHGSAGVNGLWNGSTPPAPPGAGLTPGLVGNAVIFDGVDDYVLLLGTANLAGDWTFESILRADTVNGGLSQGIIGSDFTATDRMALKAEQFNETGQIGYTLFGVIDVTFADPGAATPADFAHLTFVGTSSGVELFVNGVSVGSDPVTTALSRHVLGAGARRADGSLVDPLTGAIDEVVIYDRALSAAEISAHFAAVPEPSTTGLVLLGALGLLLLRAYTKRPSSLP